MQLVENVRNKTAHIVGYIGDWHSHPRGASTSPSSDDMFLISDLAEKLRLEGLPALMIIVGDDDISYFTAEAVH